MVLVDSRGPVLDSARGIPTVLDTFELVDLSI